MFQAIETSIQGCLKLSYDVFRDSRGTSIKPYHQTDFRGIGISVDFKEDLMVWSSAGVMRGLHYQGPHNAQHKLVCCLVGAIQDVVVDIRRNSPTYGKFETFDLSEESRYMLFVDVGLAHGYLALTEGALVMYKMSSEYDKGSEGGILWNSLGIPWKNETPVISLRDSWFVPFKEFVSPFF